MLSEVWTYFVLIQLVLSGVCPLKKKKKEKTHDLNLA